MEKVGDSFTIKQGKITQINHDDKKSNQTIFKNTDEAIEYMVSTGNAHNLSILEKERFSKMIDTLASDKGYSLLKEKDNSYTIIALKSKKEIKNTDIKYIFKELKNLKILNFKKDIKHYAAIKKVKIPNKKAITVER